MHVKWAYILIPSFLLSANLYSLDLYEAFSLVKKQSLTLKKIKQDHLSVDHRVDALDGRFDAVLNQDLFFRFNKNQSQSPIETQSKSIYSTTVLSKKNAWGSLLKTKFEIAFSDVKLLTNTLPSDAFTSDFIRSQRSINPAFDTKIEIEISQPLYRNWLGKELTLEKEIAEFDNIPFRYRYQIIEQQLQYEIEDLFLQYSYVLNRQSSIQKMVRIREKNVQLILDRKKRGRSENLDVARSKVELEKEILKLVDIESELKKIKKTIFYYLFPKDTFIENSIEPHDLEKQVFKLPGHTKQQLIERALSNRVDLKENTEKKLFNSKRMELVKERQKIQLDGFVSFSANGIDNKLIESFSNTISSRFPQFYTGIKLNIPLGDTVNENEILAEVKNRKALVFEREKIESDIKYELDINLTEINTIDQKIAQLEKIRKALLNQKKEETIKYKQARSDQLLFSSYDIQLITMDLNRAQLLYEKRRREANIRLVCHGYSLNRI